MSTFKDIEALRAKIRAEQEQQRLEAEQFRWLRDRSDIRKAYVGGGMVQWGLFIKTPLPAPTSNSEDSLQKLFELAVVVAISREWRDR